MNNFINVRVQSYNHTKQLNILKHNLRKIKSLSEGAFNDVVGTSKHTSTFIIQKDGSLFELENKDFINLSYDFIVDEYKKDRKLHNEKMYKRKKRNLLNEQATWLEGVFTFSEAIHHDLGNKYTIEELSRVANNCAQDLAKQIGAELKYMVFHLDETTPHFHLAFKNFDEAGMSIFHKIKNKEFLSQIQDLAFEHFKELGMDRGIKKEFTSKNYQTIQNYNIEKEMKLKQNISILEMNFEELTKKYDNLNNEIKILFDTKKELVLFVSDNTTIKNNLLNDIELIKNAKETVKNDFNLTKEEKKKELDKLDIELKEARSELNLVYSDLSKAKENIKNIDFETKTKQQELEVVSKQFEIKSVEVNDFKNINKSVEKQVDKIINDLIENPLSLLGKDAILDIDTLKDKTKQQLKKAFKTDIKSKEVEEKDKVINDLKSELEEKDKIIENKDSVIEKVSTEKYQERSKNKILEQNDISKTNEINKLKENHKLEINRLKNDFKQKLERRVKRLNLINRLRRSNIANKVRNRLLKRKENYGLDR